MQGAVECGFCDNRCETPSTIRPSSRALLPVLAVLFLTVEAVSVLRKLYAGPAHLAKLLSNTGRRSLRLQLMQIVSSTGFSP